MLSVIFDGEVRKRPGMFGLTCARDLFLMINGLRFCQADTKEEKEVWEEFGIFTDWVVKHYKGTESTSWWGIIDANAADSGIDLFYELLDEFREKKISGKVKSSRN